MSISLVALIYKLTTTMDIIQFNFVVKFNFNLECHISGLSNCGEVALAVLV